MKPTVPLLRSCAIACALLVPACAVAPTHADAPQPSVFTNPSIICRLSGAMRSSTA